MSGGGKAGEAIAWVEGSGEGPGASEGCQGRWGHPDTLCVPLSDRSLRLGDGLFETVFVEEGRGRLLQEHLERWHAAARLLGMAPPPDTGRLEALLAEAVERSGIRTGALRLHWSRGQGGRGLDLPRPPRPPLLGSLWLQLHACAPSFAPLRAILSRLERRNAASLLSRCKTPAYGGALVARGEALAAGADDALLRSTTGELCCSTTANLLVRLGGIWCTPPLASGCLPGVMRGRALATGLAREERLDPPVLRQAEGVLLINSLGCRPVSRWEGGEIPAPPAAAAEALWRALLVTGG